MKHPFPRIVLALVAVQAGFLASGAVDTHGQDERRFVTSARLSLGTETNLSASVRVNDLDGDDDLDVVVANGRHWPQQNFLMINQGSARFNVQRPLGIDRRTTYATECADFDGDGDLDIAVGNDMAPNRVLLNDGSGRFESGETFGVISSVRSLTLADIDQDGNVDILATSRGRRNEIYLNDGTAHFAAGRPFGTSDDSTIDVAVADFNGDGHPDLALANRDDQPNVVLLNDGQTGFAERIALIAATETGISNTRAIVAADINHDGNIDLVTGNIGQPNEIHFGDGKGDFSNTIQFGRQDGATYSLSVADMDNDGDLDIVAGHVSQQNAVFFNQGSGKRFRSVRFADESEATYGIDTGDIDGDGYRDIAVANSNALNRIYLNRPSK